MLEVCLEGIRGFLHTMKRHKLLGQYSKSEVNMIAELGSGIKVGGRADLVIIRDEEIGIYDGKNSKAKEIHQPRSVALVCDALSCDNGEHA